MKNKPVFDLNTSEKLESDLAVNAERQREQKVKRRESVTPKIVVCPPMEEITGTTPPARGSRLLKALGNRLSRRSTNSLGSSSSSDSVSCDTSRHDDHSSSSSDSGSGDSGSDSSGSGSGSGRSRRHRSTVSLCRMFQGLSLSSRSQSCSPTERQRPPKKQQQPKRILRPPVTYTYARGLSGLPTQRIPRYSARTSLGLNR